MTNSQPIPMPKMAFITNWTDDRWTTRTTRSATATARLARSATFSSRVVSQVTVNRMVGTAASIMPRRPPSAFDSWCRTTDSTVSTEALGPSSLPTAGCPTAHGRRGLRFAHGMSS